MSRARVAFWLVVLAPIWPLLIALAVKHGAIAPSFFGRVGDWYLTTSPLTSLWIAGMAYGVVLWVVGLLSGNASTFDVHWSMLPASVYLVHFALHPSAQPNLTRAVLLFIGVWFWSLRLTGNWLTKGGLGFEDFRYINFRKTQSPVVFQIFQFVVLFEMQSAMVIAMALPAWFALKAPGRAVGILDVVAFFVVVGGVLIEWIADLQGMAFRAAREAHRKDHPQDLEGERPTYPRFPQQGLWKYSRHPNYFGEVSVWWGVYLFGVAATGEWLNWTIVGPLTINGLFVGGSIGITEKHELFRKPEYAEYQRTTSRLIPLPPGR